MRIAANQRGEAIFASPTVIWELVAHLANKEDRSYNRSMKALVFLAHHAAAWSANDHRLQCVPFGSALTCHALFGKAAENDTRNALALSQMAYHARLHAPDLSDNAFVKNAMEFADQMNEKERAWVISMQRLGSFSSSADQGALQRFFADEHFLPL
ncbi:MAG: hypothetical protein IPJ76_00040 [Flavobacteriales bacterium]|nr:MAG: hypothetical protein IPJ76_00040 [Flavobacteriales bacterium]